MKFFAAIGCAVSLAVVNESSAGPGVPSVSIVAVSNATENGATNGLFRLTRTGNAAQPLSVSYSIRGTARNGIDYARLSGSITFPAGQSVVPLNILPLDDSVEEQLRTVELSLTTAASPFTLAILPDTQVYVSYPVLDFFESQIDWIIANKDARNIVYVLQEGDCTEYNTASEWTKFRNVMSQLDGVVPYAFVPGNHDGMYYPPWDTSLMNQFYPVASFASWPTFGGVFEPAKIDNSFHVFEAGGLKWLVLALEFGPRDEVLAWASQVVSNHPSHKAILVTHAHVYSDDKLYGAGTGQAWAPTAYGRPNDGIDVWNKFIRRHPNFALAFNGHVLNDGAGRVVMTGDHGNKVYQMLGNYQHYVNGGNSLLRIVEFTPDEDKFAVQTYAPYSDTFFVHPKHDFAYTNLGWFSATNAGYQVDPGQAAATVVLHDDDTDSIPPTIVGVSALGVPPEVVIQFSEPVGPAGAQTPGSYALNHGAVVLAATLDGAGTTVTLLTSQLSTGLTYTLTVNGIRDVNRLRNLIRPDTLATFQYQSLLMKEGFDGPQLSNWTIVDQGTRDAPSNWYLRFNRLEQSGNIYGPHALAVDYRLGTFAYWNRPAAFAWSNYVTSATLINPDDDGIGLLFRYSNPSNYYKLELDRQRNFRRLYRLANGVETMLAVEAQSFVQNAPTHVQVRADAGAITATVNGAVIFGGPVTDPSPLTAGTVALYCWGSFGAIFDNVAVAVDTLPPPGNGGTDTNTVNPVRVVTLVPVDASWTFWPFEFNPGFGWNNTGYDDGFWPGPNLAVFAREPDPLPDPPSTDLDIGPMTYYFRTRFDFDDSTNGVQLRIRVIIDDGAIVYLNGAEIWRLGMPPGEVDVLTPAAREVGNADYEGPYDFPTTNLLAGENVLGVEVHQSSPSSEDIVFGAELEAIVPLPLPVRFNPPQIVSTGVLRLSFNGQLNRVYEIESSTDLSSWTPFMTHTNRSALPVRIEIPVNSSPRRFYRAITLP